MLLIAALQSAGPDAAARSYPSEFTSEAEATGRLSHDPPVAPVGPRRGEHRGPSPGVRRLTPRGPRASGALSGKVVYLSPGHGWVSTSEGWATQRPNTFGVVEDLSNGDGIAQFLVPYLLAAGAEVVAVRELDPNPKMVILDNGDGASHPDRGRYSEDGEPSLFSDAASGWEQPTFPLTGRHNPFEGSSRIIKASSSATARATFAMNVPAPGYYYVYIAYSMNPTRASDAEVVVKHPGGEVTFAVDQRRHGGTWVLLDRFHFEAGTNPSRGAVVITNRSADAAATVSVDAVRLGGGMGLMDRGNGVSQKPRAEECSRYHAQFAGAPSTVYDPSDDDRTDDVRARARFAGWVHSPGEDAVFVSHHTNASNGTGRGTLTFVYGTNPVDGTLNPTEQAIDIGSLDLAKILHETLVSDIRAEVDPKWRDGNVLSAYFGEINPKLVDDPMASALVEVAFHDNELDAALLSDASFRQVVGRALYKGIVRYFAGRDGVPVRLLPEPPVGLLARNTGPGEVTVSWQPPPVGGANGDPPTSYVVERSENGYAFNSGSDTGGNMFAKLSALTPGSVLYLRVRAVNDGGRSLPSKTLAVGVGSTGGASLLLVGGYDRLDVEINVRQRDPSLGEFTRLLLDRMNNGTYLVTHGAALQPSGLPFDSCLRDAIEEEQLDLGGYQLVIWQAGRGATAERGITEKGRDLLTRAFAGGLSIAISGTTVARTLAGGTLVDQELLELLGVQFVNSELPTEVTPSSTGMWSDLDPWTLSEMNDVPYDTGSVDRLAVASSAQGMVSASYTNGGAAVEVRSRDNCSVLLGFPLEGVQPVSRQAELLGRIVKFCEITPPAPSDASAVDGGAGDGGAGDGGDGGGGGCSCEVASPTLLWPVVVLMLFCRPRRRR